MTTPTLGDPVLYNEPSGLQRAALVTMVKLDSKTGEVANRANLIVFRSDGDTFCVHSCPYDDKGKPGTWCWPLKRLKLAALIDAGHALVNAKIRERDSNDGLPMLKALDDFQAALIAYSIA